MLEKMTLTARTTGNPDEVAVELPPTRPDVIHECDLVEDATIAYGFNNLPNTFPPTSTVAQPLNVSKVTDIVRREWALAGWVEVFPFILVRKPEYPHKKLQVMNNHILFPCLVLSRRKL